MRRMSLFVPAAMLLSTAAQAVTVEDAWSRATPPNAPTAAIYARLKNPGGQADRLVAVEGDIGAMLHLHHVERDGSVQRMRASAGVDVPAGGVVDLRPGGDHVMIMQPVHPLTAGERFPVTFVFEHAGRLRIDVQVKPLRSAPADKSAS